MMSLHTKSIAFLVFASLGLIALPLAVSSHFHLFADGAYYFARLVEFGAIPTTGSRFFSLIITQLPTLLALQVGTSDIAALSYIYGASLYYLPFICYAIAVFLLFRKGMYTHAILLVFMYTVLVYFTSYFIISESHFSSGLFVLALSIIATRCMQNVVPLLTLLGIGVIALFSYEFWALFFPVCMVFFLYKIRKQATPAPSKFLQASIVFLYSTGLTTNMAAIMFFQNGVNRDAMFSTHINSVWYLLLPACLFFGSVVIYGCLSLTSTRRLNLGRRTGSLQQPKVVFYLALRVIVTIAGFSGFVYFYGVPSPQNAYALRSLNLFLPLLFAMSLFVAPRKLRNSTAAHGIACYCVLPILVLTMHASLHNTAKWSAFKGSLFTATQQQTGFVAINEVELNNPEFVWGWTAPTLSILVQAMQGGDVRSIVFDPNALWQPYDSSDLENVVLLIKSTHSQWSQPPQRMVR